MATITSHLKNVSNKVDANETAISGLSKQIATSTSNVLMNQSSLSFDAFAVTKNFSATTYTGNGGTQDISTGIGSVDFTVSGNGSGFWHDRSSDCTVKNDAGTVVPSGSCVCNVSKVHIKERSSGTDYHYVVDGIRGVGNVVFTNVTDIEAQGSQSFTAFSISGFTVGNDGGTNENGGTHIAYQTLYTHIKWGTTNQGKKYIEAYNPITRETMLMYEGSGNAGHEIPHSLGVELDEVVIKHLNASAGFRWNVHIKGNDNKALVINTTAALADNDTNGGIITTTSNNISLTNGGAVAELNKSYILYGKARSETWTIVSYAGTGASGNFIETKDVNGVARKPRRVIVKCVSASGSWMLLDTERGDGAVNVAKFLELHTSGAEFTNSAYGWNALSNGFDLDASTTSNLNASGGQYIALVEFDTNATITPDDSYFNKYEEGVSSVNITAGKFAFTDGLSDNGFNRTMDNYSSSGGLIVPSGTTDGRKYVGMKQDNSFVFLDNKPMNGLYEKQFADDNRLIFDVENGLLKNTVGGELVTNGTFDTDVSGWAASSGATLSIDSERLKVVQTTTDNVYAYQDFTGLTSGDYTIEWIASGNNRVLVNYTNTNWADTSSSGSRTFTVGSAGTLRVELQNLSTANNTYSFFDDISVYKLEPTLGTTHTPLSFIDRQVMVASETIVDVIDDGDKLAGEVVESLEVVNQAHLQGNVRIIDFGTVYNNNRYVVDNPFGNDTLCSTEIHLLIDGVWSIPGSITIYDTGANIIGTEVGAIQGEGIVVQTGFTHVYEGNTYYGGVGGSSRDTSSQARVVVTYIGEAK